MKTTIISAIAGITMLAAPVAADGVNTPIMEAPVDAPYASPVGFNGFIEYNVEADTFDGGLGVTYDVSNSFTVFSDAHFATVGVSEVQFEAMDLGAEYHLSPAVDAYARVRLDDSLSYAETTVGMSFDF